MSIGILAWGAAIGAFAAVFTFFRLNDFEEFYRFTGLTVNQFAYLADLVDSILKKKIKREPLTPEFRLAAVLR